MKTINTMTLTSMPVSSNYTGIDRTADEDARVRREVERDKLRRLQGDARRHADAEVRLADAMARASARTAQLARPSRVAPESAALLSTGKADDIQPTGAAVPQLEKSMAMDEDEIQTEQLAADAREALAVLPDPAGSLLQRLSQGQSRGLLQDCTPMLESLIAQWASRTRQVPAVGGRDRESLESALEFLQGYADASATRMAGAERLAQLVMQLQQQLQAPEVEVVASTAVITAASHQMAAQSPGKGHAGRTAREREYVNGVRKVRHDSDDQASDDQVKAEAAGAAAVAGQSGQGKVAMASESSLDKDQRKRRDETLPLLTLRSI